MFYTKNPIQYSNISVYIYLNTTVLSFQSFKDQLEIVLLQESAKNKITLNFCNNHWVAIFTAPKNGS